MNTPNHEDTLLKRITVNPRIFGGKPIIRGRRLAVEHVLGMLAAGDSNATILEGYHGWSRKIFRHVLSTPAVWSAMNASSPCRLNLPREASARYLCLGPVPSIR
jgi:uncharacterized protein (DUF433 family)